MISTPTLYKIQTHNAAKDAIAVETTTAATPEQAHVLFCGGFHSSMRGLKADFLADLCQQRGWHYTRFDYRGHGESDGQAEHCTLQDWLDDTLAVIDQLPSKQSSKQPSEFTSKFKNEFTGKFKSEFTSKLILVGSSMGAWLATHALLQRPTQVRALVTIAAAPDFPQRLLWPALTQAQQDDLVGNKCITRATPYDDTHWRIRLGLFTSGKELALLDNKDALDVRVPIRMLHGTEDNDIPWESSQTLLEKFRNSPDATLTLIQGADHRLSEPQQLKLLQEQLDQLVTTLPST